MAEKASSGNIMSQAKRIWDKLTKRAGVFHKPDPTPLAVPVVRQMSLHDRVKLLMEQETFRRMVAQQEMETFEEADDFEVGEDYEPQSDYELVFDGPLNKMVTKDQKAALEAGRAEGTEAYKKARSQAAFTEEVPRERKRKKPDPEEPDDT